MICSSIAELIVQISYEIIFMLVDMDRFLTLNLPFSTDYILHPLFDMANFWQGRSVKNCSSRVFKWLKKSIIKCFLLDLNGLMIGGRETKITLCSHISSHWFSSLERWNAYYQQGSRRFFISEGDAQAIWYIAQLKPWQTEAIILGKNFWEYVTFHTDVVH